jgi:four helix bundle protein
VLNNGLFLLDVSPFWQQVVKGFVILAAVAIDKMTSLISPNSRTKQKPSMPHYFPHENLEVYAHAVSFAKFAAAPIDSWPAVFAVCDQMDRATESVVTNLAKAACLNKTQNRIHWLECSLGSVLECAACLDVAYRRHLVPAAEQKRERYTRRIDELSTSLTINIAEGNGRFSKVDHSKFVSIAEDAGTKLAAYLDLLTAAAIDSDTVKAYLREVLAMLGGLKGYLEREG